MIWKMNIDICEGESNKLFVTKSDWLKKVRFKRSPERMQLLLHCVLYIYTVLFLRENHEKNDDSKTIFNCSDFLQFVDKFIH
jgi:hypothetical protein